MGFPEIALGVCTGWGGTQRLPRHVGLQAALDLLMTGRLIDAREAFAMGLLHSVCDTDAVTAALADMLREAFAMSGQADSAPVRLRA